MAKLCGWQREERKCGALLILLGAFSTIIAKSWMCPWAELSPAAGGLILVHSWCVGPMMKIGRVVLQLPIQKADVSVPCTFGMHQNEILR